MSTARKPLISPAAQHTLDAIDAFIARHRMSPTLRELGAECGVNYSVVAYHIKRLKEVGEVEVIPNVQRGIRRVKPKPEAQTDAEAVA